jgi:hypothetical protein
MGLLLGKDLLAQIGVVPSEQLLHLAVGAVLHGFEPADIHDIISAPSTSSRARFQSPAALCTCDARAYMYICQCMCTST